VRILCGIIDIWIRRSGIVGGADATLVAWSFSPMLVVLGPAGGAKRSFTTVMSSIWRKKEKENKREKHAWRQRAEMVAEAPRS